MVGSKSKNYRWTRWMGCTASHKNSVLNIQTDSRDLELAVAPYGDGHIYDRNIPAFNLAKVMDNRIEPGTLFTYFKNKLKVTKQYRK